MTVVREAIIYQWLCDSCGGINHEHTHPNPNFEIECDCCGKPSKIESVEFLNGASMIPSKLPNQEATAADSTLGDVVEGH